MVVLVQGTSGAAFAQSAEPPVIQLDEIILTGEKLPRNILDTPSSVVVIGSEEIGDSRGSESVSDLVRGIPNIIYPDTVSAPVIRGQDTQGPNFGAGAFFGGTVPAGQRSIWMATI